MSIEYELVISINLGTALAPVGDLLKEIGNTLAMSGYPEKLSLRSKCIRMQLTTQRELTDDEKEKMKKFILETFTEDQPAWKAQIESFRRKSGNVQQSAA